MTLEVIMGIKKEEPKYWKMHSNAFIRVLENVGDKIQLLQDMELDDRRKVVWHGVKNINTSRIDKLDYDYEHLINRFNLISSIKGLMGTFTPREFQTIFPIDKEYDGGKYGAKDYFHTRKYIVKIGEDKVIGEGITKFLWEYMNATTRLFEVELMSVMSAIRRAKGGKGIVEEFMEEQGVTMHTLTEDGKGNKFLINNDTGEMQKMTKPRPKHLKVLK